MSKLFATLLVMLERST